MKNGATSFMVILASIIVITLCTSASGKDGEDSTIGQVQETLPQATSQPKQRIDPFTIAIIGMSLGCMCVVSSVHWTLNQRKRIEADIQHLDNFLINSCAVDFHIIGSRDNDPMLHMIKGLQENQSTQLQEHASQNNAMVKKISDIESEIMRILG